MDDFCQLAKAISDPTRVRILKMLEAGELCVCHIAERLGSAQSTVSKHLAQLRQVGLVAVRRQGLWAHYRLTVPQPNDQAQPFSMLLHEALNDDAVILEDRNALANSCCASGEVVE
jgi:DNA-binding transcriptional ArsR family regulator